MDKYSETPSNDDSISGSDPAESFDHIDATDGLAVDAPVPAGAPVPLTRDYIGHEAFLDANKVIEACHRSYRSRERPLCARLQGVSGVGKTSVMKRYRDRHPVVRSKAGRVIKVLYVAIPPQPTIKNLWTAMLTAMEATDPGFGTAESLRVRLVKLMRACKVELLLVDEVHHFVIRGSARTHSGVADALKVLIDEINIPCVMGGATIMEKLFQLNNQLRNRFFHLEKMRPFDGRTETGLANLAGFVMLLLESSPGFKSFLEHPLIYERIFYATDGVPRQVVDLLRNLRDEMNESGVPWSLELSAELFRKFMWPGAGPQDNPFCIQFEMRRLNASDEPFEPSDFDGDNHA